ncbi:MAG: protein kinase [Planctomycetota bacterium]
MSLIGSVVDGWEVVLRIGQGATGTVYEARRGAARAALKVIRPDVVSPTSVERFRRESALLREIDHPHVVRCLGAGEHEGHLYLVLEFLGGGSLEQQLRRRGRLSVPEAVGVTRALLAGLQAVHAKGTLHRDLKPANVLLDAEGWVKLADFNLARREVADTAITSTGTVVGTPYFMAPEQARGMSLGPAADLYAVGAVLFALVAGRPPYEGTSSFAVLQRHLRDPVPDLCAVVSDAPPALGRAVAAMMAKDPEERPGSAAAALELLAGLPEEPLTLETAPAPRRRIAREQEERDLISSFNLEQTKGLTSSARWRSSDESGSRSDSGRSGTGGTSGIELDDPTTALLGKVSPAPAPGNPAGRPDPLPPPRPSSAMDLLALGSSALGALYVYDLTYRARGDDLLGYAPPLVRSLRASIDHAPFLLGAVTALLIADRVLLHLRRVGLFTALGWRVLAAAAERGGRPELAAERLARAGDRAAAAALLVRHGRHLDAAGYYRAAGELELRAECLLLGGRRDEALVAYREVGNRRALLNAARLGDTSPQAVDALLAEGLSDEAAEAHLRAGRPLLAADVLEGAGRLDQAVQALETALVTGPLDDEARLGLLKRVAGLHLEREAWDRAAHFFEEAGEVERAAELYARLEDHEGRARCLLRDVPALGKLTVAQRARTEEAARLYARLKDPAGVTTFVRLGDYVSAAELSRDLADYAPAAQYFARAGRVAEGAVCAERAGNRELAAFLHEDAKDYARAAELYAAIGQLERAAEAARKGGLHELRAELLARLGRYLEAARSLAALGLDGEALDHLSRVPRGDSTYLDAQLLAGELHHAAGRHRLATRAYQSALPERVESLETVGPTLRYVDSLVGLGLEGEALEVLERFRDPRFAPPDLTRRRNDLRRALEGPRPGSGRARKASDRQRAVEAPAEPEARGPRPGSGRLRPESDRLGEPASDRLSKPASDRLAPLPPGSDRLRKPASDRLSKPASDRLSKPASGHLAPQPPGSDRLRSVPPQPTPRRPHSRDAIAAPGDAHRGSPSSGDAHARPASDALRRGFDARPETSTSRRPASDQINRQVAPGSDGLHRQPPSERARRQPASEATRRQPRPARDSLQLQPPSDAQRRRSESDSLRREPRPASDPLQLQPPSSSQQRQPASDSLRRQPPSSSQQRQTPSRSQQRQPASDSQPRQPASDSQPRQPASDSQPRQPASDSQPRPPASDSLRRQQEAREGGRRQRTGPGDPAAAALVGARVAGYELRALLSVGSLTWNFEALGPRRRPALVKLLAPAYAAPGARQAFVDAGRRLIGARESALLEVLHAAEVAEGAVVCFAPPGSETLAQRLTQEAPLALPRALRLGRGLLAAIAAAHARDLLHLDLRPTKVHLAGERLQVADFGFVQAVAGSSSVQRLLDPRYSAPELWRGDALSPASDQYSAALLLYKALTAKLPFQAKRAEEFAALHADAPPVPASRWVELPAALDDAILRALAKDPRDRFPGVEDLRALLDELARAEL